MGKTAGIVFDGAGSFFAPGCLLMRAGSKSQVLSVSSPI